MKKLLIMASLLAVTSTANATLPSSLASRPAGFKDPNVEGIRVRPAQGCTWAQFRSDLIANKSDILPINYSIERYHNTPKANSKYAVVFSVTSVPIWFTYTDNAGVYRTASFNTISDADRLNKLRTFEKQDKNYPLNYESKSKEYREHLEILYSSYFDATTCVDFEGFEYKWSLAAADPTQFVKANTNWAAYQQEYGLSLTEQSRVGKMAVIDGTVNLNGIKDPSRVEVVEVDDLDNKPFIKQAYSEAELLNFPADRLLSTVNDTSNQHANAMFNLATDLSHADILVLPTAPGGNVNLYSADTPKLNNATMDSLEKATSYLVRHAVQDNITVVTIPADIPPEANQSVFLDNLEQLRDMNISVIVASGNNGIEEVTGERSTYPDLAGTTQIVNGAPNIVVGILGPDGNISSDYGPNKMESVVRVKEDAKTIENYAPGNLTSVVDVTLGGLDLNTGATGGSSYASIIVSSLAVDLKAKFPWMSSDEFKTGLVQGLFDNRPEPPFAASQAELDLFNEKWSKVSGGMFDAKLLADYLKEFAKPKPFRTLKATDVLVSINSYYPVKITPVLWRTTWGLTDATAAGLCAKIRSDLIFIPESGSGAIPTNGACYNSTNANYGTIYADVIKECPFGGSESTDPNKLDKCRLIGTDIPVDIPTKCPIKPGELATTSLASSHANCKVNKVKEFLTERGACTEQPLSIYCHAITPVTMNGKNPLTGAYKYYFISDGIAINEEVISPWACPTGSTQKAQSTVPPYEIICG